MKYLRYLSWIDLISKLSANIAYWFIVPLIIGICYDVVARYFFNAPTIWSYELSLYFWSIIFLLGMGYVLQQEGNVCVDIISKDFPFRIKALIGLLTMVICLIMCYFLIVPGMQATIKSFQMNEVGRWSPLMEPIWFFRFLLPLGFFILGMQAIKEFIRYAIQLVKGESHD